MPTYYHCSVKSCISSGKTRPSNVKFHRFPSDPLLRKTWEDFVSEQNAEPFVAKNQRLCTRHFASHMLLEGGICWKAVPTVGAKGQVEVAHHGIHKNQEEKANAMSPAISSSINGSKALSSLYTTPCLEIGGNLNASSLTSSQDQNFHLVVHPCLLEPEVLLQMDEDSDIRSSSCTQLDPFTSSIKPGKLSVTVVKHRIKNQSYSSPVNEKEPIQETNMSLVAVSESAEFQDKSVTSFTPSVDDLKVSINGSPPIEFGLIAGQGRKAYLGDMEPEDFATPKLAAHNLELIRSQMAKKNKMLIKQQQTVRRLKAKVKALEAIVRDFREPRT